MTKSRAQEKMHSALSDRRTLSSAFPKAGFPQYLLAKYRVELLIEGFSFGVQEEDRLLQDQATVPRARLQQLFA